MRQSLRKLLLGTHLAVSVGWLGAVAAYLALDITSVISQDAPTLRAVYIGMGLVVQTVIVPLACASLLTGVWISLGTGWGLFRHYWVLISLILTVLALGVLLVETGIIGANAEIAADPSTLPEDLRRLGNTLVHSVGGLVILSVVLALNVYKPRGMTRHGWRKHQESRTGSRAPE